MSLRLLRTAPFVRPEHLLGAAEHRLELTNLAGRSARSTYPLKSERQGTSPVPVARTAMLATALRVVFVLFERVNGWTGGGDAGESRGQERRRRTPVAEPAHLLRVSTGLPRTRFQTPLYEPSVPISSIGLSNRIMYLAHGSPGQSQSNFRPGPCCRQSNLEGREHGACRSR